jgi:hypothetical protein
MKSIRESKCEIQSGRKVKENLMRIYLDEDEDRH